MRAIRSRSLLFEHLDRYGDPDLLAALRQLPDAQRAAVILFYYADLPIREIAARLGIEQPGGSRQPEPGPGSPPTASG